MARFEVGATLLTLAMFLLPTGCSEDPVSSAPTTTSLSSAAGGSSTGSGGAAATGGSAPGGNGGWGGAASEGGQGGGITDFSAEGPYAYTQTTGQHDMPGCGFLNKLDYSLFAPTGAADAPLVVLGHGLGRDRERMVLLAHHLATHGLRVATIDYCHLKITDVDHAQNAADQVTLATALAGGAPVIHAGYSAGGLSSLVATSTDSQAVALLLLDGVEKDGLGQTTGPSVSVPTFGLVGEPHLCNSQNGGGVYLAKQTQNGWSARVIGATHCDFEGPSDVICTVPCGGEGAQGQRELIRSLATAFIVWQAGVDPSGEAWVSPSGSHYQAFETAGDIQSL